MKVVVAIDSFKGCLNSKEANQAAAEGITEVCPAAEVVPVTVSDGGEGFLEAFQAAFGGQRMEVTVSDPLMRPVIATYLLQGKTAVMEMAQASGLTLLTPEERNPMVATTYGTGQMVADAVKKGATHLIVGLGGSATSDAGIGMLQALADSFGGDSFDVDGHGHPLEALRDIRFTIASDVKNPLCGIHGAAHVFAPQKFPMNRAKTEDILALDERARAFAERSARRLGYDRSEMEGAGAAGGLGYAFLQYLDAECRSGIDLLLDAVGFDDFIEDADCIITGEGAADRQTLMGKLPMGILNRAAGRPVWLIAGKVSNQDALLNAGFAGVECINPPGITLEEAMRKEVALQHIRQTVGHILIRNYV